MKGRDGAARRAQVGRRGTSQSRTGASWSVYGSVLALLVLAPAVTRAQAPADRPLPRNVRLEYARGTGAEQCPDESYFRDTVERRVSYAPFVVDAPARLVVTISREGSHYRGRWEVFDAAGLVRRRDIPPAGVAALPDCYNLVQGVGLAFAVELEPLGRPVAPVEPAPSVPLPVPTFAPRPIEVPAPPPVTPPAVPRPFFVALSGVAAFAETPDPAGGASLAFGRRWGAWSLAGEVRGLLTLNNPISGGVHSTLYRVTGALVPCGHWRWLLGCAVLEAGALGASSDAPHPLSGSSFVGGAGLRLGLQVPLGDRFALRIAADGLIALPRVALVMDGIERWRSPAASASIGGGLVALF